ncbi:hypothetical protein CDIK_0241 [Cucumispora dikerogammari]|nr:hypothetical protein CDIK_0241 [Cucumispora dikerogammari]
MHNSKDKKAQEVIDSLLNEPGDVQKIEELTEILKNSQKEKLASHLKHLAPIFLLQQLDSCINYSADKKISDVTKILDFFFLIVKTKEICEEMHELNFPNVFIFMLIDSEHGTFNETHKLLFLLILSELLKYKIQSVTEIGDLFTILMETIQNGEVGIKNLAFFILKLLLLNPEKKALILNNEQRLNATLNCFKKDVLLLINSGSSSLQALECLDVFLNERSCDLEQFQYLFDRKIFFKLEAEEKKKINEIKRKYVK